MGGAIYVLQDNGELVDLKQQDYDSEDLLQQLLANYPNLLAGDQMNADAPRRWVLVSRELGLPSEEGGSDRWSVDHLFLDQDAIPTLVEVKRSSDTRIRREVVGQLLEYAANATAHWTVDRLKSQFETTCQNLKLDSSTELYGLLGSDADFEGFWQQAWTNLQAGRIRLVFVADKIPHELQSIVEFLNRQMDPAEVLAVEIKQFVGKNMKTLVPRVVGATAEAQQRKSTGQREKRQWDEGSFFAELQSRQDVAGVSAARKILTWAKARPLRVWWGQGAKDGSFMPMFDLANVSHFTVAVRTGYQNSYLQFQFGYMVTRPSPFQESEMRLEMIRRLNEIPGVSLSADSNDKYPSVPLGVFGDDSVCNRLLVVLDWYLENIKSGLSTSRSGNAP